MTAPHGRLSGEGVADTVSELELLAESVCEFRHLKAVRASSSLACRRSGVGRAVAVVPAISGSRSRNRCGWASMFLPYKWVPSGRTGRGPDAAISPGYVVVPPHGSLAGPIVSVPLALDPSLYRQAGGLGGAPVRRRLWP